MYNGRYPAFRDFLDKIKLDLYFHAQFDRVDALTPPVSPSATVIPVTVKFEPPPLPPPPLATDGTQQPNPKAQAQPHVKNTDEENLGKKSSRASTRLRRRRIAGESPDPVITKQSLHSEGEDEDEFWLGRTINTKKIFLQQD